MYICVYMYFKLVQKNISRMLAKEVILMDGHQTTFVIRHGTRMRLERDVIEIDSV